MVRKIGHGKKNLFNEGMRSTLHPPPPSKKEEKEKGIEKKKWGGRGDDGAFEPEQELGTRNVIWAGSAMLPCSQNSSFRDDQSNSYPRSLRQLLEHIVLVFYLHLVTSRRSILHRP